MTKTTRAQRETLARKWIRSSQGMTYREFRRTVQPEMFRCVCVLWCGMYLVIEPCGYSHT